MSAEDLKISELDPILASATASGDLFVIVDVSDATMAPTGTDKNLTRDELKKILTDAANTWTDTQIFAAITAASVKILDSAGDHGITFDTASNETADRTITIPALGGNKTLALIDLAQTYTAQPTFPALVFLDAGGDHTLAIDTATDEAANRTLTVPALGGNHTFAFIALAQTWGAVQTFGHGNLVLFDSDASHRITIQGGNESADRTLSIPVLGASAEIVCTVATQTIGGAKTFTNNVTVGVGDAAGGGRMLEIFQENGDSPEPAIKIHWENDPTQNALQFYVDSGGYGAFLSQYGTGYNTGRATMQGGTFRVGSSGSLGITSNASPYGVSQDISLKRTGSQIGQLYSPEAADGVLLEFLQRTSTLPSPSSNCAGVAALDVAGTAQFFSLNESAIAHQLTGLCKQLASDATNATTTMANLTGLTVNLVAGKKYSGKLVIYCANSLAADGAKFDLDGGSATMTTFRAHGTLFDTALLLSQQTSALATDFAQGTVTGDAMFEVHFSFVCNAAGTLIPRFAGNAAVSGTLTAYKCSYITMENAE